MATTFESAKASLDQAGGLMARLQSEFDAAVLTYKAALGEMQKQRDAEIAAHNTTKAQLAQMTADKLALQRTCDAMAAHPAVIAANLVKAEAEASAAQRREDGLRIQLSQAMKIAAK